MSTPKTWLLAALCAVGISNTAAARIAPLPQTGCDAWRKVAGLTLRGTSDAGGLRGTFAMTLDAQTGRYGATRNYGAFSRAEGFDGRFDWARDRSGASHSMDSAPAQAIAITEAWLLGRGWCGANAQGAEISPQPDEKDSDVVDSVWRVVPRGGVPAILRFEHATGVLRQTEVHFAYNRVISHFSDWRDIGGGVMIAFSERDDDPEDESVEMITLKSASVDASPLNATTFARSQQPRDTEIAGGASSATVPYEDDGVGRIYVPVSIDGKGPFPFEIDTGGHFILTDTTAAMLHLQPVGNSSATGAGTGIAHEGTVPTHDVRIGAAVMRNLPAWVLALSKAGNDRGPRPPRAGILGLELFERFAVALDRKAKTVTLTPLAGFAGGARGIALPIRFTEDAPIATGSFEGVKGDFELDSGDAGPAIVEGYWAAQHGLNAKLAHGIAWTGGGVGGEYGEKLSRGAFTLGTLKLPHEVVSYVGQTERGSESTHMQAGVIGESSLYRFDMTYDYAHELVWIDPDAKIPPRPFNRTGLRLRKDAPDSFTVTVVVPGSPADATGIKAGDKILSIGRRPAAQLASTDASAIFSGPVGSDIELVVAPKGRAATHTIDLRLRDILP